MYVRYLSNFPAIEFRDLHIKEQPEEPTCDTFAWFFLPPLNEWGSNIWLSVGGHIEPDEDPHQAAIREVGIDIELDSSLEPAPGS